MFVQRLLIEPVLEHSPSGICSGQIEVSMTPTGFSSEQDMFDWVDKLATQFRDQWDVKRMEIGG